MNNKKTYQVEYVASDLVRVIRKMEIKTIKQSASMITPEYIQNVRMGLVINNSIKIGR